MLDQQVDSLYKNSIVPFLKKRKIQREFRECMQDITVNYIFGDCTESHVILKQAKRLIRQAGGFNRFYQGRNSPINTERMSEALGHAQLLTSASYRMGWF